METIGTLLDERLVVLDADVSSAEDCIRLMAGLFEQYGYVQPGYGDAVAVQSGGYDLIAYTSPVEDIYGIPVLNATGFLVGINEEEFVEELLDVVGKLAL